MDFNAFAGTGVSWSGFGNVSLGFDAYDTFIGAAMRSGIAPVPGAIEQAFGGMPIGAIIGPSSFFSTQGPLYGGLGFSTISLVAGPNNTVLGVSPVQATEDEIARMVAVMLTEASVARTKEELTAIATAIATRARRGNLSLTNVLTSSQFEVIQDARYLGVSPNNPAYAGVYDEAVAIAQGVLQGSVAPTVMDNRYGVTNFFEPTTVAQRVGAGTVSANTASWTTAMIADPSSIMVGPQIFGNPNAPFDYSFGTMPDPEFDTLEEVAAAYGLPGGFQTQAPSGQPDTAPSAPSPSSPSSPEQTGASVAAGPEDFGYGGYGSPGALAGPSPSAPSSDTSSEDFGYGGYGSPGAQSQPAAPSAPSSPEQTGASVAAGPEDFGYGGYGSPGAQSQPAAPSAPSSPEQTGASVAAGPEDFGYGGYGSPGAQSQPSVAVEEDSSGLVGTITNVFDSALDWAGKTYDSVTSTIGGYMSSLFSGQDTAVSSEDFGYGGYGSPGALAGPAPSAPSSQEQSGSSGTGFEGSPELDGQSGGSRTGFEGSPELDGQSGSSRTGFEGSPELDGQSGGSRTGFEGSPELDGQSGSSRTGFEGSPELDGQSGSSRTGFEGSPELGGSGDGSTDVAQDEGGFFDGLADTVAGVYRATIDLVGRTYDSVAGTIGNFTQSLFAEKDTPSRTGFEGSPELDGQIGSSRTGFEGSPELDGQSGSSLTGFEGSPELDGQSGSSLTGFEGSPELDGQTGSSLTGFEGSPELDGQSGSSLTGFEGSPELDGQSGSSRTGFEESPELGGRQDGSTDIVEDGASLPDELAGLTVENTFIYSAPAVEEDDATDTVVEPPAGAPVSPTPTEPVETTSKTFAKTVADAFDSAIDWAERTYDSVVNTIGSWFEGSGGSEGNDFPEDPSTRGSEGTGGDHISCQIQAEPDYIAKGQSAELRWHTTNGSGANAILNYTIEVDVSDSMLVAPTTTTTYLLSVEDGFSEAECETTVTVVN